MKNRFLAVCLLAAAAPVAAAPVSSVCTFQTAQGQAQARFDIENRLVRSTLTVDGVSVPAVSETCYAHKRGGLRCPHDDGRRRYELFPWIDDATDQVTGLRVLVYQGDAEPAPIDGASCQPL